MDFDAFDALTFDCYGTLIDWETGILSGLGTMLGALGALPSEEELLQRFARLEAEGQSGPYRPYRTVLMDVALRLGSELGLRVTDAQAATFAGSVGTWRPFDDSVEGLRKLASRYRLAVVSNVDDDLFRGTSVQLQLEFEHVVTAQQVRSYKPSHAHFHEVMRRLELPTSRVLHVAQSIYHDIRPAAEVGLACVWVNRRGARTGRGATMPAEGEADAEVPHLTSLVREMGLG